MSAMMAAGMVVTVGSGVGRLVLGEVCLGKGFGSRVEPVVPELDPFGEGVRADYGSVRLPERSTIIRCRIWPPILRIGACYPTGRSC